MVFYSKYQLIIRKQHKAVERLKPTFFVANL